MRETQLILCKLGKETKREKKETARSLRTVVPVNISVSSQGNATCVILAATNMRTRSRKILLAARGGEQARI